MTRFPGECPACPF
jgi:hypothetical protein